MKLGSLVMSAKVRCKLTEKCFGKALYADKRSDVSALFSALGLLDIRKPTIIVMARFF